MKAALLHAVVRTSVRLGHFIEPKNHPICCERPALMGSTTILNSYPPIGEWSRVGNPENYFIHNCYQSRASCQRLDKTSDDGTTNQWQVEVYQFAREVFERDGLKVVADIGCGSGNKLMHFFRDATTVGLDIPQTIAADGPNAPGLILTPGRFPRFPLTWSLQLMCLNIFHVQTSCLPTFMHSIPDTQ